MIYNCLTEDIEALSSPNFICKIARARAEKKRYSAKEIKEILNENLCDQARGDPA